MRQSKLLLFFVVLLSMVGNKLFAYDIKVKNVDGVTIYYNFINDGKELEVTNSFAKGSYHGYNYDYSGDLIIPEHVEYNGNLFSVTAVGFEAFVRLGALHSVSLPNSVTQIKAQAFMDCGPLTTVNIPNSVTYIGSLAFSGTAWLNNQPDGIVYAGKFAYKYKGEMPLDTKLEIDEGTIGICGSAFSYCSNLVSVNIPQSVTYIDDFAFTGCTNLVSVNIPNSVTFIGFDAFRECKSLTTITIPQSDILFYPHAFSNCTGLSSVTILSNNITFYSGADTVFENCSNIKEVTFDCKIVVPFFKSNTNLKKVTLTGNVTNIGYEAFCGCSGITSLVIPNSVTSIGDNAFNGCKGLTSISIPQSVTSIGHRAFKECEGLTSISIPQSVTSIGSCAFEDCSGLVYVAYLCNVNQPFVDIFRGCSNIKEAVFNCKIVFPLLQGFSSLEKVTMMDEVTEISYEAFMNCESLYSTIIPNGVTSIKNSAFSGCKGLTTVVIGSGVTSIENNAFYNTNLKKTIWLPNTPPYGYKNAVGEVNYVSNEEYNIKNQIVYKFLSSYFDVDGIRYVPVSPSEKTCDAIDCVYDKSVADTKISSTVAYKNVNMTVNTIQPYLAHNNKYIETLYINIDGELAKYAFSGCNRIKNITLGKNISAIGNNAFSGCSSLPSITIPQTVMDIKDYVFSDCTSLKEVNIADSNIELNLGSNGNDPFFSSCPLETVYIGRKINYNTSSNKGYSPFYRNVSLKTVIITDKETEISENEFYGCSNLKQISIGDGVTTIGNWAFSGCSNLNNFSFGSHVQSIGKEAFSDCTSLIEINSKASTPPNCGLQALDDINKWECKLIIPAGCLALYQAANQWKDFFYIEENPNDTGIHSITKDNDVTEIYSLNGNRILSPSKGINIIKMKDGTTKKVLIK